MSALDLCNHSALLQKQLRRCNIGLMNNMSGMQWGRADVTIVMAGSSPAPAEAPQGTVNLDASSHAPASSPQAPCADGRRGEPVFLPACPVPQPSFPPLTTQAANLFQSVVAFVGDGCALVDDAQYRQRLEVCRTCGRRNGKRCTACGCWINVKARGRAFACPLGRWG